MFFDVDGRLLMLRHSYGSNRWGWPGGVAEAEEPPRATARREVEEEIGLVREPGPLLVVDWERSWMKNLSDSKLAAGMVRGRPDGIVLIFDGGAAAGGEKTLKRARSTTTRSWTSPFFHSLRLSSAWTPFTADEHSPPFEPATQEPSPTLRTVIRLPEPRPASARWLSAANCQPSRTRLRAPTSRIKPGHRQSVRLFTAAVRGS